MAFLAQKLISASGATEETDDDFNLVTQLYQFDGSNGAQNNTYVDSSSTSKTLTCSSNLAQGTFSPFSSEEGKWGIEFAGGTGQTNLTISATSDFAFGTGDYTVEAWVFPRSLQNSATLGNFIIDFRSSGNTGACFVYIGVNGSGDGVLVPVSGNAVAGITLNVWNHIAVTRESSTERTFINGVLKGSNTNSTDFSSNATATIGSRYAINSSNWSPVDGFISNLRVVKGTAVYTSAFTPSTYPLTAVTNTKLLTSCSNRFRDKSTSAHSMTANGTPKIKPFSPFAPNSSYNAAVKGGSANWPIETDKTNKITVSSSADFAFGTSAFTVECWVYVTADTNPYSRIWQIGPFFNNNNSVGLAVDDTANSSKTVFWAYAATGTSRTCISTNATPRNEWFHVAVTRDGTGDFRLFVNGNLDSTNTSYRTTDISPSGNQTFAIGNIVETSSSLEAEACFEGFISNLRLINGSALYTSSFTVPTAPVTDVTNTKLLANFTNAAMFDQTGKTNVETVGNAQLDTSVKKFGSASAEFDGTGDYLIYPLTSFIEFKASDWTIECFVNVDAVSTTYKCIYSASYGVQFYVYNNLLYLAVNDTDNSIGYVIAANSATGSSASTWHHVAAYRLGSAFYCSIDGVVTSMGTSSATIASPSLAPSIGIWGGQSYPMDGYIDEFRITRKARYGSSNFTAPTKEFPNR